MKKKIVILLKCLKKILKPKLLNSHCKLEVPLLNLFSENPEKSNIEALRKLMKQPHNFCKETNIVVCLNFEWNFP